MKKLFVLNLDNESVQVLNISALSDTCTLLFPQDGDSPLHIRMANTVVRRAFTVMSHDT